MKIVTLLLMMIGMSVAQAEPADQTAKTEQSANAKPAEKVEKGHVYKCPGKMEGHFVYQDRMCQGAKTGEHTIKIVPADAKKIAEAQAKLASDVEAQNKDKKELPTGVKIISGTPNTPPGTVISNPANAASAVAAPTDGTTNPAPAAYQAPAAPK